jgi:hypothetical protein
MASRQKNSSERIASGRNANQFVVFAIFIAGMVFALPTMLVLTLGLLPTLVALVVDLNPRKYAARAVGFLNIAGSLPFLFKLWFGAHSLVGAMKILTDVFAWLVIYSAAAMGWLIYMGMPQVAGFLMELNASRQIRRIDARRSALVREWGEDIALGG